jgi:NAD(P)-dependent dehydrogenase (short-subunit alcohol dehydrogenase family)
MPRKVILITGASSGIGLATALRLARAGHIVYGGARRTAPMQPIVDAGGHALGLDVTNDASMTAAVDHLIDREGRIDVLINNAGYASYGAVEDIPMNEARRQLEVNIFGLARMTQLVMPHMRAAGGGRIINISSVGGTIWTPLGAWYHLTKWGVEGFTNAMRIEAAPHGIDMILVAPGFIRTDFGNVLQENLDKVSKGGAYEDMAAALVASEGTTRMSGPEDVARALQRAVEDANPKAMYRAGAMARLMPFLARVLPRRAFDGIMKRALG